MWSSDPPKPVHIPGSHKGEEVVLHRGKEPGRAKHGQERPYRTARDATSVRPEDHGPIDPRMPHLPPN